VVFGLFCVIFSLAQQRDVTIDVLVCRGLTSLPPVQSPLKPPKTSPIDPLLFMSRKPPAPVKKTVPTATASEAQESIARAHLEKGRFREAVVGYKALLKTERRAEWVAGLANAYSGRAHALADKGMLQEALGLWRSRAELCGTPLWDGPYADWLLDDGRVADVLDHLDARRADASMADTDELTALEARLAPALLSANQATLAKLPADSLLLLHRPLALAALAAYSSQDDAALETALAGISFRSPYRNLRTLLKILLLSETDVDAARAALQRLPVGSPFESLAAPLRTRLLTGLQRLQQWAGLTSAQQTLALDLIGYPLAAAPMLHSLAALAGGISASAPAALFDLVLRHSRELPNGLATQAWQWLAPWAVRRGCASPRLFGSPSEAAQECATALAVEIKGEQDHADTHWLDAADFLMTNGGTHDRLRAALVLRHVALSPANLSSDGLLHPGAQKMLTKSLALDPDDCAVHVRLIQYWRRTGDLKSAREQLEAGLRLFPDDPALLTEAVETAVASGAFKKAAASARRLLAQDPLNRKVRALVGNAHLSHAVKQIVANKRDAAKKEIAEAASWLTSATDQGRMQLLQAWTEPAGSAERLRLAQLAVAAWGGGLTAGWRLVREAQGVFSPCGLSTSTALLTEAGIATTRALTPADLLELLLALEQETALLRKGLDPLAVWRKALASLSTKTSLDEDTCVRLCEAFSRHQEFDLAEKIATAARIRWPDKPIFIYHAVAARAGKNKGNIPTDRDFDDLERAQAQARENRDLRLMTRIEQLFEADNPMPDFGGLDLPDLTDLGRPGFPFGPASVNPDMFRKLLELTIQSDGGKLFLANARRDLGDALVKQVERECAGDKKAFFARLMDLVIAGFTKDLGASLPGFPTTKPKTPLRGQKNPFNE